MSSAVLRGRALSSIRYIIDSFWASAYQRFVEENGIETVAPFSLKDAEGRSWSLDEHLDMPTLLVFTSPHCQPCKSLYPVLRGMRAGPEAESLNLVLVSRGATRTNRLLIEENELEGLTVLGGRKHVEEQLNVKATPWVVLVGLGGRALYSGVASEASLMTLAHAASHRVMTGRSAR